MSPEWFRAARARGIPTIFDPTFWIARRALRGVSYGPVTLIAVYRHNNARTVQALLDAFKPVRVALWALDEPAKALQVHTVGCGPGTRPELLNRLNRCVTQGEEGIDGLLLVCDDDVRIAPRHARLFLKLILAAELDVAQPGHLFRSYTSWSYVRRRPFTLVRLTAFVEQGPVLAFSERGVAGCFPLREDRGMGWGLEADWARLATQGLRLGIVDGVGMRHLNPVSSAYDRRAAEHVARRALAEAGFESFTALQVTLGSWRPTQEVAAWLRDGDDSAS